MSVRHYGIYLAYAPLVDLREQGLGRYLSQFLKGAVKLTDVRFTIVCPSWTRSTLEALIESEGLSLEACKIVSPEGKPYVLIVFEAIRKYLARPRRRSWLSRAGEKTVIISNYLCKRFIARTIAVHDLSTLLHFFVGLIPLLIVLTPLVFLSITLLPIVYIFLMARFIARRITNSFPHQYKSLLNKVLVILLSPQSSGWIFDFYEEMQKQEMRRMQVKISALADIRAWYCPTAFWPDFHDIDAPRLMCVPDVVLSEYPADFSVISGERLQKSFEAVEQAIRAGKHYITYSEVIKWNTLVDRYAISSKNVTVIPHASMLLNHYLDINGFIDNEKTSCKYAENLLLGVFNRNGVSSYTASFRNKEVKFLFFASQFRPNKNVLMLLKAYEYLLRKCYLKHKLFLTGSPEHQLEVQQFVINHRLQNDVIFLNRLTVSELAACYKLADLAVNPTLSEGGLPFTFSEALSVGTPVVMSRIPVAEEVLTDRHMQDVTFFDPFDYLDCARRIEWAVSHREELLEIQNKVFVKFTKRTWSDVVTEHIRVLDKISEEAI